MTKYAIIELVVGLRVPIGTRTPTTFVNKKHHMRVLEITDYNTFLYYLKLLLVIAIF